MQTKKCKFINTAKVKAVARYIGNGFFYYLRRRPAVTIFFVMCAFIITLSRAGFFVPENRSVLVHLAKYNQNIDIEGRVVSFPIIRGRSKQFTLQTYLVGGLPIRERVRVFSPPYYEFFYGDIISVNGYLRAPDGAMFPGTFNYRNFLASQNIYSTFRADFVEFVSPARDFSIRRFAFRLRAAVIEKIDTYFQPPYSNIVKAIFAGEGSGLDREVRGAFQDVGLVHVLVVSGLHLGYFALIIFVLLRLCLVPYKYVALIAVPLIAAYALFTGGGMPVIRSSIMISCVFLALTLKREPLVYNALAISAIILLLINPQNLFSPSAQLSYSATIGIVTFYGYFHKVFSKWKNFFLRYAAEVFCITLAAEIAIAPLIMYYFGRLSIISIPANIVLLSGFAIVVVAGFVFAIVSFISSAAATAVAWALAQWLSLMVGAVKFLSSFAYSAVYVIKPTVTELVFFYAFILAIPLVKNTRRRIIVMATILGINLLYFTSVNYFFRETNYAQIFSQNNVLTLKVSRKSQDTVVLFDTGRISARDLNTLKGYLRFNRFNNLQVYVVSENVERISERLGAEFRNIRFIEISQYENIFEFGGVEIDRHMREITYQGETHPITQGLKIRL